MGMLISWRLIVRVIHDLLSPDHKPVIPVQLQSRIDTRHRSLPINRNGNRYAIGQRNPVIPIDLESGLPLLVNAV